MTDRLEAIYRRLPAVGALMDSDGGRNLLERYPRPRVASAIREILGGIRASIARDPSSADIPTDEDVLAEVGEAQVGVGSRTGDHQRAVVLDDHVGRPPGRRDPPGRRETSIGGTE